MSKGVISSINLCPINFKAFGAINRITSNIEATLLYSKIFFHQRNSIILFDDKTWIIRSRKELASWYLISEKKIDSLISLLFKKGLLEKKIRLWKGKRHLMLHAKPIIEETPVNHKMLELLLKKLGSISSVIVFAKIAFHYNNSIILHENKKWCSIKKQHFSEWSNISLRKLDSIFEELTKIGIILKKNFLWQGKRQLHFHIPNFAIETISQEINIKFQAPVACANYTLVQNKEPHEIQTTIEKSIEQGRGEVVQANALKYRYPSAKIGISIINRTKRKKTNNNTTPKIKTTCLSDISLMSSKLSVRQERYLKAALENTINRSQIKISNKLELFEELKFSVSNAEQHKFVYSFPHAVSRCMKIIAQNNWRTPRGFYKHSLEGKSIRNRIAQQENNWEIAKKREQMNSDFFLKKINSSERTSSCAYATDQAIRITNEITKTSNNDQKRIQIMLDHLHKLIHMGADRNIISNIMRKSKNLN